MADSNERNIILIVDDSMHDMAMRTEYMPGAIDEALNFPRRPCLTVVAYNLEAAIVMLNRLAQRLVLAVVDVDMAVMSRGQRTQHGAEVGLEGLAVVEHALRMGVDPRCIILNSEDVDSEAAMQQPGYKASPIHERITRFAAEKGVRCISKNNGGSDKLIFELAPQVVKEFLAEGEGNKTL